VAKTLGVGLVRTIQKRATVAIPDPQLMTDHNNRSAAMPDRLHQSVVQAENRPDLPDYLRPGLDVIFVGFNPGDRSSRIGHYYAGRGNQFWNFLFESGLIAEKLAPEDDCRVLEFGIGLTDVVKRWSKSSSSLRAVDYQEGVPRLLAKLRETKPRVVAFNGKLAYEKFSGRAACLGLQNELLDGACVFVLPSTSGRNGSLTRRAKLAYFCRLARWVKCDPALDNRETLGCPVQRKGAPLRAPCRD
jgi:TDG/mug DNA glycosylase family protein